MQLSSTSISRETKLHCDLSYIRRRPALRSRTATMTHHSCSEHCWLPTSWVVCLATHAADTKLCQGPGENNTTPPITSTIVQTVAEACIRRQVYSRMMLYEYGTKGNPSRRRSNPPRRQTRHLPSMKEELDAPKRCSRDHPSSSCYGPSERHEGGVGVFTSASPTA